MRQSGKPEGTKIAQAAKDLNVTSVTIRRYIAEFNIETTADENGIKVLPDQAMEELQEIRRLKEDGLTNPKVLEFLEDFRKQKPTGKPEPKAKAKKKAEPAKVREVVEEPVEEVEEEAPKPKKTARRITAKPEVQAEPVETVVEAPQMDSEQSEDREEGEGEEGDGKSKHSLTCQTCSKVFEHMNPRLRDCLECYRAKRKERRRGGSGERHKNVIQHPLAQQVASKAAQQTSERDSISARAPERERIEREPRIERERAPERERSFERERSPERDRGDRGGDRGSDRFAAAAAAPVAAPMQSFINVAPPKVGVRNYRKAIEETRQITGSLKRRLERPDLPEGERRWLEQIYAYQLILHQGWRHLAEYRAATPSQGGAKPAHQSAAEE